MMDEGTAWDQRGVATTPTIAGRKLAFVYLDVTVRMPQWRPVSGQRTRIA